MEPEDYLNASSDLTPPAGPDELRAIVARAGRRTGRLAAGGVAVALLIGAGVGYAVSDNTSHGTNLAAATSPGQTSTTEVAPTPYLGPSSGVGTAYAGVGESGGQPFTHLFTRSVGQIDIRGYLTNLAGQSIAQAMLACGAIGGPQFQAEVSTPAMVGTLDSGFTSSGSAITASDAGVLGAPEGSPTAVVVVGSTSAVSKVKVAFAGGAVDEMAPVHGWSALAEPLSAASAKTLQSGARTVFGTLYAYNSAGKAVEVEQLFDGANTPVPGSSACTGCPPGSAKNGTSSSPIVLPDSAAPSTANVYCAGQVPPPSPGRSPASTPPATFVPTPPSTVGRSGPPVTVGPTNTSSGSK